MLEFSLKHSFANIQLNLHHRLDVGITGVYGPSGAGKSSLLRFLAGLLSPQEGELKLNEEVLYSSSESLCVPVEKREVGYVFQDGRLFPHLSVRQNLEFGFREGSLKFDEVVALFQLQFLLEKKTKQLSGGERQRVAIARTLLSQPKYLLLDEPFSAVDVRHRLEILPFLYELQDRLAIPIVVVSHDLQDLLKLTTSLLLIENGMVLGKGCYSELLKLPSCAKLLSVEGVLNSWRVELEKATPDVNYYCLSEAKELLIKGSFSSEVATTGVGHVFLAAEDVSLSLQPLQNVTIQNQWSGVIQSKMEVEGGLLVCVDVGVDLFAKITKNSWNRLRLQEGKNVICLFKSVAIGLG